MSLAKYKTVIGRPMCLTLLRDGKKLQRVELLERQGGSIRIFLDTGRWERRGEESVKF